jgi:Spy/CpxP family protein refolding chaperone
MVKASWRFGLAGLLSIFGLGVQAQEKEGAPGTPADPTPGVPFRTVIGSMDGSGAYRTIIMGGDGSGTTTRSFSFGGDNTTSMLGAPMDQLQRDLNLTEAQRSKIKAIVDQAGESIRQKTESARASGEWQSFFSEMTKSTDEARDKVKAELTVEQREKYAKALEEQKSRSPFQIGTAPVHVGWNSPDQRIARAMEALKIGDAEEAEAIKSLIARLVKLQADLAAFDRATRDKAGEILRNDGMADEALNDRLKTFRADRKALENQIRKVQEELGQVLTVRQEVELVRQGILR